MVLPSRNAMHATLIMGAMWLALWVGLDRWQSGPAPQFSPGGIPLLAWYALAIMGLAALMQWRTGAAAFGPVLALAMGAVPVPLLFLGAADVDPHSRWFVGAALAVGLYVLLYLSRGLRAITGVSQRTAACAGLLFIVGFCLLSDALDAVPDVWTPLEAQAAEPDAASADSESILFEQAGRIDEALEAVQRAGSPKSQAFFLGFAGVGDEKVFAQEVGLASRILGERYAIGDRRVSLINDQRDLERVPLATVSGLKYALRGLGSRMNVAEDVLFLSISSHGAQDPAIAVSNSQLPLNDLTDEALADALHESGIQWRVIIISACYAGGFIERRLIARLSAVRTTAISLISVKRFIGTRCPTPAPCTMHSTPPRPPLRRAKAASTSTHRIPRRISARTLRRS
jgi:hypothetical protein